MGLSSSNSFILVGSQILFKFFKKELKKNSTETKKILFDANCGPITVEANYKVSFFNKTRSQPAHDLAS